jgi:hypothetical protein
MTDIIDHKTIAWSRLAYEYRNAENLKNFIAVFCKQAQEIEDVLFQLLDMVDIDKSEGHQLDVIGKILGQSRNIASADIYTFFGFDDGIGIAGFDEGYWWDGISPISGNLQLPDDLYRNFLKAKVIKNYVSASGPDILHVVSVIFPNVNILYIDGFMEILLYFGKQLTETEKAILMARLPSGDYLLPKPEGVRLRFAEYDPLSSFAFAGDDTGKGFDDGYWAGYIDGNTN